MEVKIKSMYTDEVETVQLKLALYEVVDALFGKKMPALAILAETVEEDGEAYPYADVTVSFGEFIGMKNCAYIDTNNCTFTQDLLELRTKSGKPIAVNTGLTKRSGFCEYPLWAFEEEFLREIGNEAYETYSKAYDEYMGKMED